MLLWVGEKGIDMPFFLAPDVVPDRVVLLLISALRLVKQQLIREFSRLRFVFES